MNPPSMLQIVDLKVELDADAGVVRALDGLRLSIERGETFALVGESGCGKSMTALALMRLLPENGRVSDGQVRLGDLDVLGLPESAMRSVRGARIGMIFQEPSTSLNPVMRVGDQIVEAIETHTALRGAAARAKAIEWLRPCRHPRARTAHRRIPVPPVRRAEAARDDRHDAGRRARLPGGRRADHGAGRDHPGADPRPAAHAAARAEAWACC